MNYAQRLNKAMQSAAQRGILDAGAPRTWRKALANAVHLRFPDVEITVQAIGGVLNDQYEFKAEKNAAVSAVLRVRSDWLAIGEGAMLEEDPKNRAYITAENVGMQGLGGQTEDVKLTSPAPFSGQILPLIPWNRVDLMQFMSDAPEIKALEGIEVRAILEPIDPAIDRAVLVESDVPGTEVRQGFLAVFRQVPPGRRVLPTDLPIVVKSPSGSFHVMSYNALALAPAETEVIAVCIDAYKPRKPTPHWD